MKLGHSLLMLGKILTLKHEPTAISLKMSQQKYELSSKAFNDALSLSGPDTFKQNFEEVVFTLIACSSSLVSLTSHLLVMVT